MRHFRATVEYDGTDFAGFQWQHGARTVQGALEEALRERAGLATRVTAAGRTDAGVHSLGQVVSFGCDTRIPAGRMTLALNGVLPPDVTVREAREAPPEFSARFSASSRVYCYVVLNRSTPSALWRRYSALYRGDLDVEAMRSAAPLLLGERDFAALANEHPAGASTFRNLMSLRVWRRGPIVLMRVEANAFLRGMVRTLAGTLLEIGAGKRDAAWLEETLISRDRRCAGPTAPPQGLCLIKVRYGERRDHARRACQDEE